MNDQDNSKWRRHILWALGAYVASLLLPSYRFIADIVQRYLLSYVFSFPVNEAVQHTDEVLSFVDILYGITEIVGIALFAYAAWRGVRAIATAGDHILRRIVGIGIVTLALCSIALEVLVRLSL